MTLSIIVLTFNNLPVTVDCVESLYHYAAPGLEWELVAVDNGSRDGTAAYWQSLERYRANLRLILNDDNRGFAGGVNLGLRMAQGEFIALVNNDVIVTPGWDKSLIAALVGAFTAPVGIACAMTNLCGNEAMIPTLYRGHDEMCEFAAARAEKYGGQLLPLRMAGFYCVAFRHSLWREIGDLDERFYPGYYEDDDWCIRARIAGYSCAAALDCYVHHQHKGTFRSLANASSIVAENRARFEAKYGVDLSGATPGDYSYVDPIVERERKCQSTA